MKHRRRPCLFPSTDTLKSTLLAAVGRSLRSNHGTQRCLPRHRIFGCSVTVDKLRSDACRTIVRSAPTTDEIFGRNETLCIHDRYIPSRRANDYVAKWAERNQRSFSSVAMMPIATSWLGRSTPSRPAIATCVSPITTSMSAMRASTLSPH